jgi:hypothetical protein
VTVIYLLGSARSGTTALSALLGSHPDIASPGELGVLVQKAWVTPEYCSCGVLGAACPFWTAVRGDVASALGADDVGALVRLQRFDRVKRLPALLAATAHGSRELQRYGAAVRAVFAAIARRAGAAVVIDSSKTPSRALALNSALGNDVRFVHVVRDPRGVAWSLMKSFRADLRGGVNRDMRARPPLRAAVEWVAINVLSEWVARRAPGRVMRVRYEDFVRDPATVLEAIAMFGGLVPGRFPSDLAAGASVERLHMIAGNRMRMAGHVSLKADFEWVDRLPPVVQRQVWTVSGWLAQRYGYRRISTRVAAAVSENVG